MRDLAIHGDDLMVATHGRSFWILDDCSPLRQMNVEIAKESAHVFAPQDGIRVGWNHKPDPPLPPEVPAGKNPPDGAIIDYYLASSSNQPVTLEIFDEQQHFLRRYSSADKPEPLEKTAPDHPLPIYSVPPTQLLSPYPSLHPF